MIQKNWRGGTRKSGIYMWDLRFFMAKNTMLIFSSYQMVTVVLAISKKCSKSSHSAFKGAFKEQKLGRRVPKGVSIHLMKMMMTMAISLWWRGLWWKINYGWNVIFTHNAIKSPLFFLDVCLSVISESKTKTCKFSTFSQYTIII